MGSYYVRAPLDLLYIIGTLIRFRSFFKSKVGSSELYSMYINDSNWSVFKKFDTVTTPNGNQAWAVNIDEPLYYKDDIVSVIDIYINPSLKEYPNLILGVGPDNRAGLFLWMDDIRFNYVPIVLYNERFSSDVVQQAVKELRYLSFRPNRNYFYTQVFSRLYKDMIWHLDARVPESIKLVKQDNKYDFLYHIANYLQTINIGSLNTAFNVVSYATGVDTEEDHSTDAYIEALNTIVYDFYIGEMFTDYFYHVSEKIDDLLREDDLEYIGMTSKALFSHIYMFNNYTKHKITPAWKKLYSVFGTILEGLSSASYKYLAETTVLRLTQASRVYARATDDPQVESLFNMGREYENNLLAHIIDYPSIIYSYMEIEQDSDVVDFLIKVLNECTKYLKDARYSRKTQDIERFVKVFTEKTPTYSIETTKVMYVFASLLILKDNVMSITNEIAEFMKKVDDRFNTILSEIGKSESEVTIYDVVTHPKVMGNAFFTLLDSNKQDEFVYYDYSEEESMEFDPSLFLIFKDIKKISDGLMR